MASGAPLPPDSIESWLTVLSHGHFVVQALTRGGPSIFQWSLRTTDLRRINAKNFLFEGKNWLHRSKQKRKKRNCENDQLWCANIVRPTSFPSAIAFTDVITYELLRAPYELRTSSLRAPCEVSWHLMNLCSILKPFFTWTENLRYERGSSHPK